MILIKLMIFILFVAGSFLSNTLQAQVEPPDRLILFREDSTTYKQRERETLKAALKKDEAPYDQGTYFNAPQIEYRQDKSEYVGSGGLLVAYGGNQIQAQEGTFNLNTKEAELEGGILLASPEGEMQAESAKFNLESEVGSFKNGTFLVEDGGYRVSGGTIEKLSELEYRLTDAEMTTCNCVDGSQPWSLSSDSIDITAGGYAWAKPFRFNCFDTTIFYAPAFVFPARLDRHSGLLLPMVGYSGEHGFLYEQPIFWNYDDSTDVILSPFTQTNTRTGTSLQVTKLLSQRSNVDTKLIFSDESARDGDLRGSQPDDLFDPTFDESRYGGYYKQRWKASPGSLPLSFIADGKYVSDDLFVREIEEEGIGLSQDRFITSRAYLQSPLGDYFNGRLSTEYSQSFVSDQDLVLYRLPELSVDGYRSFRVFGQNPYGLKLVSSGALTSTSFGRQTGYDGQRHDINPRFKIPYYYKNIVEGDVNFSGRQTWYSLSDTIDPATGSSLDSSNDRSIYDFGARVGSVLERVYDIDSESWFGQIAGAGYRNQYDEIKRAKHTIEPYLAYQFTPDVNQDDLPLFDATDRIRERSVISYGLVSRLIGRFADIARKRGVIEELAPEQVSFMDTTQEDEVGSMDSPFFNENTSIKRIRGERKQLALFGVRQSYDQKLEDTDQRAWSDIATDISFYPNSYFAFGFNSTFDYEDNTFSSWNLGAKIENDRGDHVRTRVSYIEEAISQIDSNVELVLTDRLRVGYYTRYDDQDSEFIENRLALRVVSSCDCWKVDLGYRDRSNPDDQTYTLLLTLKGLGDIGR